MFVHFTTMIAFRAECFFLDRLAQYGVLGFQLCGG